MSEQMTQMLGSFGPLVIIIAVFYFMMIRPQKKKDAAIKDMRTGLKVGDDILTIGGIIGKIVLVKEDYVVIETSSNKTRLDVMKWGISSVIQKKSDLKSN